MTNPSNRRYMRVHFMLPVVTIFLCLVMVISDANAQRRGRGRRGNEERNREAIANGWQLDYASARDAAQRTNRPLMVVFRCVP